MKKMQDIYFHEATIRDVRQRDRTLLVSVEEAKINGVSCAVEVQFSGIQRIIRDSVDTVNFLMEQPDGEILTFSLNESGGELVIEWNDFMAKLSEVHSYEISCERVMVRII